MADYTSAYTGAQIDAAVAKANTALQSLPAHTHTAAEVGALPETYTPPVTSVNGKTGDVVITSGGGAGYAYNLLDNSNFRNPVNQRGVSGTISDAGYFLDRWKLVSGSVSIGSDGITLNGTISQILEMEPAGDVTATASAGTASYNATTKTYTITATGVLITWAALYEGSYTADTLPPYVPKGYAAELAQCKRYYNIIPYDMDDYYVNANTAYPSMYPVFFPEMRIIPTVTLRESWNTGSAGVSVGFITKSSLAFQAAATSSRVAWHGKIELDADL